MTVQLRGVLTALATPFTADGSVDEALLRTVVDRSIDGGVHGVVACGSTGEFTALSGDERRLVVETVVDQAGAPGAGDRADRRRRAPPRPSRLSRHAQSAGADVIMPVAPYYEPLSLEETLTYLRAVAGSVDIPVMLYNLPMATGVDLDPDTVGALAREVENIRYIKNTTIDMAQSAQLIHNYGDVISTFVGWDSLLLAALAEGAAGVMAGTANVVPAELVAVYDAVSAGDLDGARQAWARIYPLIDAIMAEPFIAAVKAGLAAVGFPVGAPAPPVAALDPDAAARIAQLRAGRRRWRRRWADPHRRRRSQPRCAGSGHGRRSCRRPTSRPASTSSTAPSGRAGPGTSIDVIDPSSERDDRPGRRGHRRGHRRRGRRRLRREARVGPADPQGALRAAAPVADRVAENADLLARLESANTGKPSAVAQDDVAQTIDTFRFMAGALRAPPPRRPAATPRTTCRSSCASRWASSGSSPRGTTRC